MLEKKNEHLNVKIEELEKNDWYTDVAYYLKNLAFPPHLVEHQKRALRLKANKYCLLQDGHRWKNLEGVILRCVGESESKTIL